MLGRRRAVADVGPYERTGFIAWLMWLFIHLVSLITFRSRLLVMLQWFYAYVLRDNAARLITQTPALLSRMRNVDDAGLLSDADRQRIETESDHAIPVEDPVAAS